MRPFIMTSMVPGAWIEPVRADLVAAITGRAGSMFREDIDARASELAARIRNDRILVIGASGSIGSAFVKVLVTYSPCALALADINENTLADLVRDLRSTGLPMPADFRTTVAALGSPGFIRFLREAGPFQTVLNFSALKHVRTERDAFGLMRMIETNALAVEDLILDGGLPANGRLFSVSTDKAVRPTSLMGATKRWMERIVAAPTGLVGTSARFANVAFSAGSLPQAFLRRLELRQPLAAPSDVQRYFISHLEAAQLCLLAAFLGSRREIFVPRLDPDRDAVPMPEVARRVLEIHGLEPELFAEESSAKASPLLSDSGARRWPCVFTPADTTGEKEVEELIYPDEQTDTKRFRAVIVALQQEPDRSSLAEARRRIQTSAAAEKWEQKRFVDAIGVAVPELRHRNLGRSLDEKM
jgi:FlaA1/EpsC-like NDP-sugar epimerase